MVLAGLGLPGIAVALAVLGYAYRVWRGSLPAPKIWRKIPTTSRWGRLWNHDIRRLLVREPGQAQRLTLGWKGPALLATERGASMLVFGPTQSGKTTAIAAPAILEWTGPVVAVSIKRDLLDLTAGWRQRRGRTFVYDPIGVTDLPSMRFSPHFRCQDLETARRVASRMVTTIDRAGKSRGDSDWAHWRDAAQRLITVAFYTGARLEAPISEVRAWINEGGDSLGDALSRVPDCDPTALEIFQSIETRPEIERLSCYSATQRALSIFIDRRLAESASGNDWSATSFLLEGENTLYMLAPMHHMDQLEMLFITLLHTLLEKGAEIAQSSPTGCLPQPLLIVLDECAHISLVDSMPKYMATGGSQGITMIAIFQDFSQVRDRYGDLADTIFNNSLAKLLLSGVSDTRTLDLFSRLAGRERQRVYTYRIGSGTLRYRHDDQRLAAPDRARQLRPGSGLLIYHYLRPLTLTLRPWHRDPGLRRKASIRYVA